MTELQAMENDLAGDYVLVNDIDASATSGWNGGAGFAPIGDFDNRFTGTFDGQGYTVSDLYINRPTERDIGLFGYVDTGAEVGNVGVVDVDVNGDEYVGGLVGHNRDSTVSNSYSTGNVSGTDRVGGLVGYNAPSSTVSNSYSTGTVSGDERVGGLVGQNWDAEVSNSYATGDVSGTDRVGGLVGQSRNFSTVSNSYSTGDVSGTEYVGGLVGSNLFSTISNSYSTGNVSGTDRVGGLVGHNRDSTVSNSYSTGTVSGESDVGGLVGRVYNDWGETDEILYSYANSDINPDLDLIGSDGTLGTLNTTGSSLKTTAEMTDYENDYPDAYSGWDFTNIWQVTSWNEDQAEPPNAGYPALEWQESPLPPILTVNIIGNGTVTDHESTVFNNGDTKEYTGGTTVTLTPNPDADWLFKEWSGDISGKEDPKSFDINADMGATATFFLSVTRRKLSSKSMGWLNF